MNLVNKLKEKIRYSRYRFNRYVKKPLQRWLVCNPLSTQRQLKRFMADKSLNESELNLLQKVKSQISSNDDMYKGNGNHYFKVGVSAIQCIETALQNIQTRPIQKILDLPCGHGRVLRFLNAYFPNAKITACDLDYDGVDFCVRNFSATRVYSQKNLAELSIDSYFDLIWCGSLATHLDSLTTLELLKFFYRHLSIGGILIFSVHGPKVIKEFKSRTKSHGLNQKDIKNLITLVDLEGYGYADYPNQSGYGVSVATPKWFHEWFHENIHQVGQWSNIFYMEQAWDNNHDVYAVIKKA